MKYIKYTSKILILLGLVSLCVEVPVLLINVLINGDGPIEPWEVGWALSSIVFVMLGGVLYAIPNTKISYIINWIKE